MGNNKNEGRHDSAVGLDADRAIRLQRLLALVWHPYVPGRITDLDILEIRIKKPKAPGEQVMCIIKAADESGRFIAFHSADEAQEALKGLLERLNNKQLKWREDVAYGEAWNAQRLERPKE